MRYALAALSIVSVVFLVPVKAEAQELQDTASYSMRRAHHIGGVTAMIGRPAGCPRAWCGCWLALHKFGRNVRHLWLARNWAREGRPAQRGCIGCVAVFARGKRGGHVGVVIGWRGENPVIRSGNHNRGVGTAEYPVSRLIALRGV